MIYQGWFGAVTAEEIWSEKPFPPGIRNLFIFLQLFQPLLSSPDAFSVGFLQFPIFFLCNQSVFIILIQIQPQTTVLKPLFRTLTSKTCRSFCGWTPEQERHRKRYMIYQGWFGAVTAEEFPNIRKTCTGLHLLFRFFLNPV